MAVALSKINSFVENVAEGVINLGGTGLGIVLTNTAHTAGWDEFADLTALACTNLSSSVITVSSSIIYITLC